MGKKRESRSQRETDRWGHFGEYDTIGIEGAFDMNPTCMRSIGRWHRNKGVLSVNAYFKLGTTPVDETWVQREINARFKPLLGAGRYSSLCICDNRTKYRYGKAKYSPNEYYASVEYYAKCGRPDVETVQEMSRTIREVLDNGRC